MISTKLTTWEILHMQENWCMGCALYKVRKNIDTIHDWYEASDGVLISYSLPTEPFTYCQGHCGGPPSDDYVDL